MTISTTLAISLLLLTGLQDPVSDPSGVASPAPVSSDIELLERLKNPDQKIRQEALQSILNDPDPALLPGLMAILNDPDPMLRRQVTLLVLKSYPDSCFVFFRQALGGQGIPRREAAAYALGLIEDPRVVALLGSAAEDPDPTIQIAALRGLQSLIRAELPRVFRRVAGAQIPTTDRSPDIRSHALAVLNQLARSQPQNQNLQIARLRCLDSEWAASNRDSWLASLDLAEGRIQQLKQFFATGQGWLGRSMPLGPLAYQFSMLNIVSGSSKEIEIEATVADIASLRALDYDLDRVIHLRIASDLFFNIPDSLAPRFDFAGDNFDIALDIERFPVRHAGIGLLNISYWESKVFGAATAHLRFDTRSFRLIEEIIKDADGKILWKLTVPSWFEGTRSMPEQIEIDIPGGRVGAKHVHLKLNLKFQQRADQWLLHEGKTSEVSADGEQIRAYCEVTVRASESDDRSGDEVGPGKSSSPAGSSAESDSGHGSRAGSRRK
jgi:hypothetical protein